MDKGHSGGRVGTFTVGGTKMMKDTDMVKCLGWTDQYIKVSGRGEFSMEKEKWYSQMELQKMDISKIMCIKGRLL